MGGSSMKFSSKAFSAAAITFAMIIGASVSDAAVLDIKALSSRPDRVSGSDVLIQIVQGDDAVPAVTLNGSDVSKAFVPGRAPTREGLVSGLKLGGNTIEAGGKSL